MADRMIVVDAEHWLTEHGELPSEGPPELFRNALRMAQCIEYAGPIPKGSIVPTLIQCRWRPAGVPCRTLITVAKTERDEIEAFCISCEREEFCIYNWQNTQWANGQPEAYDIPGGIAPPQPAFELSSELHGQLSAALRGLGSHRSVEEVQQMVVRAETPNTVIQQVLGDSTPRGIEQVQALAGALMEVWNATPRAELGGRAPVDVYEESPRQPVRSAPKVGRNQPCPCGSGLKNKKCCGLH
tara:strand:+ start:133 stop:858 length:726 start_codon:yes stop_codon:yes gene_type:complete